MRPIQTRNGSAVQSIMLLVLLAAMLSASFAEDTNACTESCADDYNDCLNDCLFGDDWDNSLHCTCQFQCECNHCYCYDECFPPDDESDDLPCYENGCSGTGIPC